MKMLSAGKNICVLVLFIGLALTARAETDYISAVQAPNEASIQYYAASETMLIAVSGTAQSTVNNLLPANARIEGVTAKVVGGPPTSTATFELGLSGKVAEFATAVPLQLNATSDSLSQGSGSSYGHMPFYNSTAQQVLLTPSAGGVGVAVTVTVLYTVLQPSRE